MPFGSVVNAAHTDPQYVPTSMGVIGTLGTSDVAGTALTLPFAVDAATGAAWGKEIGTPLFILAGGTLNAGTVTTGAGTQKVAGAVNPSVLAAGGPVFIGGTDSGGTIQGALVDSTGAVKTTATLTLNSGTISAGTVGGKAASGVAAIQNPIFIGGTDSGGTIYGLSVNSSGNITTTNTGTNVNVVTGTINVGTFNNTGTNVNIITGSSVGTLLGGTLQNLVSGTVTALAVGTVGGKAASGAAAVANPVQIAGTDGGGTVYSPLVSTAGVLTTNLTSSGTILNLASGTLAAVTAVTTVSNLTAGSVTMTVGTLTTGTLQNLVTGTINALAAGTITGGTLQNLNNGTLALVTTVTTVSNLTNGSVTMTVGTLTTGTLQNLVSGTINALAAGTITAGTIVMTTGTLSPLPTIANSPFGTHGTTGVSVFGTIAGGTGSGAGTEVFVTSVSMSIPSTGGSQDVSIGFGTNGGTFHAGTGLLVRGNFPAGGGIQKTFWPPVNSGTNANFTYFQAGAGTVDVSATYFVTASTL